MDQNMQNQDGNICYCRRCRGMIHQVKRGDTLYAMSRRYGVPVGEIISANPFINIYNLRIGQEICIPIRNPQPRMGTQMSGETEMQETKNIEAEEISEEKSTEGCCQDSEMMGEEYEEKYDMRSNPSDGDDFVLTGEEKLAEVLERYDMDMDDFMKCIRKEK